MFQLDQAKLQPAPEPEPEPDATESPLTDALPPTQRFKPVGRVSLDVNFPTDGKHYHFKKLKDHAKLTLEIEQASSVDRPAVLGGMALCLGLVILSNFLLRRARATA